MAEVIEPRRGRPPGEVTPELLLRAELIAHLKLYKQVREVVQERINEGGLSADDLGKYMDLIRKGIVEMAKPVVPNAKASDVKPPEELESADSILNKLINGPGRTR